MLSIIFIIILFILIIICSQLLQFRKKLQKLKKDLGNYSDLNEDNWKVSFKEVIKNSFGVNSEHFKKAQNLNIHLDNSGIKCYGDERTFGIHQNRLDAQKFIDVCISDLNAINYCFKVVKEIEILPFFKKD